MEVKVYGNNLEVAVHQLKKAILRDGILKEIERREKSPNKTDRRKAKAGVANRRRLKKERLRIEREEAK